MEDLPIVATLKELDKEALIKIITEPKNSLVKQYKKLFEIDGVELEFEQEALEAIVDKAIERKTGARGLRSIIEDIMRDIMFEIPSNPKIEKCIITKETVENGEAPKIIINNNREIPKKIKKNTVLTGDKDWTQVEFLFNSKKENKVKIGFRLGGNLTEASGTAWFSDIKIEKGVSDSSTTWNFGCFLLNNADVIINNEEIKVSLSEDEKATIRRDMTRLEKSIKEMSNNQINISYEIIEIDKPLTTLSYDDVNGYYISEADAYKLLVSEVLKKDFDHVFICTNLPLESELTRDDSISEWIGLGNMIFLGKGYSNIRITPLEYQYSSRNTFPEEVFLHEFLHTLERNAEEYGNTVPALHDYEKYGYKDDMYDGQRKWYMDYMNRNIKSNGEYIGLPAEIYKLKPAKRSDFEYSYQLDLLDEPHNIIEEVNSIIEKIKFIFKSKKLVYNVEGATK